MNISALMLTTPDRWFFRDLAIETFLSTARDVDDELVIVTEEDDLGPAPDACIRYITVPLTSHVSEKRNLGVEACRHDWIMMWDDDDWHGVQRLLQARSTLCANPTAAIVGHDTIFYVELVSDRKGTYRYQYGRGRDPKTLAPYVLDGTMTFARELWKKQRFAPTVTRGDGGWWVVDQLGARDIPYAVIPQGAYVATLHEQNTSARLPRIHDGVVLSDSYMTIVDPAEIERVFPRSIWNRYQAAAWAQQDKDRE